MKKRISLISLLTSLIMIAGGCVSNAQSQFADYLNKQDGSKFNAGTVVVSLVDLEFDPLESNGAKNPMTEIVMGQLKNVKFSSEYQLDPKNSKLAKIDTKLELMDMVIPFDMITKMDNKQQVFISTNILNSIGELSEIFGNSEASQLLDFGEFEGKYIDVMALLKNEVAKNELSTIDKKQLENAEAYGKAYRKELVAYLKTLDKKTFIKKNETISHEFTKKELLDIAALSQKVAKSNQKFKNYHAKDTVFVNSLKKIKDISLTMQVNPQKSNYKMTVIARPDTKVNAGVKSITLKIDGQNRTSKESIKLPSKKEIVSKEIFEVIAIQQTKGIQVDDDQFKELKADLIDMLEDKENLSKENVDQALRIYKRILTTEQYQELEAVLK